MSRAREQAERMARHSGYASLAALDTERRRANRRANEQAERDGIERRLAERRATDSHIIANWTRRFEAARNGGLI